MRDIIYLSAFDPITHFLTIHASHITLNIMRDVRSVTLGALFGL